MWDYLFEEAFGKGVKVTLIFVNVNLLYFLLYSYNRHRNVFELVTNFFDDFLSYESSKFKYSRGST